jgi:ankyrin repeat protein
MKLIIYNFFIIIICLFSCQEGTSELNFKQFKYTKAADLAVAVEDEDIVGIDRIVKIDKVKVDFQEPSIGNTLLSVAILTNKKNSIKKLLELGADPNIKDRKFHESPFFLACSIFKNGGSDINLIKLLLAYNANINDEVISDPKISYDYKTPLIISMEDFSVNPNNELFYFLLKMGADINQFKIDPSFCPVSYAINFDRIDLLKVLIIDKKANIPDYTYIWNEGEKEEKRETLVECLKKKKYDINSKKDKLRNEILNFLFKKGYN